MSDSYKIVFRGDIAPGHSVLEVKSRLAELFRLDDESVGKLFSGRPITIKRNLTDAGAKTWCDTLLKAGAVAQAVVDDNGAVSTAPLPQQVQEAPPAGLRVEPVGADVLSPAERADTTPRHVDTDHLSLDTAGADLLRPHERRAVEEPVLDLSHLRVAENP